MPRFRTDVSRISPYTPGRPIADVAAEFGFDPATIVKLASNECPLPPFEAVQAAMAGAIAGSNRYPDNDCRQLRLALADSLGVPPECIWPGGGTTDLLRVVALATGGPGTSAVYAWPSFVVYRLASIVAMAEAIEVPLTPSHHLDLDALQASIRPDTTIVYVCNPNNPSGSHRSAADLETFIDGVPEDVLVVVDEAYHEYVTASDYRSAVPLAVSRPNVMVTRTFSKIYGLAGLRVGYAIARPELVGELRKAHAPFSVSTLGQVAAVESLRHPDEVARRAALNAAGRTQIESALLARGIEFVPSQTNFIYLRVDSSADVTTSAALLHGVVIRPFGDGWVRASVGTTAENDRLIEAIDGKQLSDAK